ncbi:MAG: three-Cys-motif partner protein TcmP, partial [Acidimicrobiia bacterium]|nr:three-Cys-motif partner protein TcmP [Acidimicrobiia bacterium]
TLSRYLEKFTTASKTAQSRLYLDLFAGQVDNVRRDDPSRHFPGSTVRALKTVPPFDHLSLFELPPKALELSDQLAKLFPGDPRYSVIPGDCNDAIGHELQRLRSQRLDWSATFALVDPDKFSVSWSTLYSIASFKHERARTKAEMLILLPHTTIQRLAGWDSAMGYTEEISRSVTEFFGTSRWRRIFERRAADSLTAAEARLLYVQLFRFRLEHHLGYNKTLTIEMGNEQGAPVYTMVFATDHDAGVRIMSSVNKKALRQSAEYRADVIARRKRQRRAESGRPTLFDMHPGVLVEEPRSFETTQDDESPSLPNWLKRDAW